MQLVAVMNRMLLKGLKLNISTKVDANKTFRLLSRYGTDMYGYDFGKGMSESKILSGEDLQLVFMSDDFKNMLANDSQGEYLTKKIKFPSKMAYGKEMQEIYNKYKNNMSKNPDDVDDPVHTYAIRTQFGEGPVVFVDGVKSDAGRKEVRRWYAWAYKVNYFSVRECSFEYWLKHPETQDSTDHMEYTDDDLYKDEVVENMNESVMFPNKREVEFNKVYADVKKLYRNGDISMKNINNVLAGIDDELYSMVDCDEDLLVDVLTDFKYNAMNSDDMFESFNFDDEEDDRFIYHRSNPRKHRLDKMFNKYPHRYKNIDNFDDFEDTQDDIDDNLYNDDFELTEDNESVDFVKGDMVKNTKGQAFIVIDTLYSDDDVERAKRKRNYRRMYDKDFNISHENPVLAVMTMKGPRGGMNYIYPANVMTKME